MTRIRKLFYAIISTAALFPFAGYLQAQPATKDYDINRDPMIVRPDFLTKAKHAPQKGSEVITIDNFDNFKLGVDFAECSIAINPLNPLEMYATWNEYSATSAEHGYRTEDGYTWVPSDPSWQNMAGDVVVASDDQGRLYFQNMFGANTTSAKIAASNDFGRTWETPVTAVEGYDKPWMAVDVTQGIYSKYLYATMSTNLGGNIALSPNGGNTFTNTNNFSEHRLPGMCVCIGPDGNTDGGSVYVVTNSGVSTASVFTFWVSHDGGQTFTIKSSGNFANFVGTTVNGRNAVENMRTRPYPYIVADNSHGPHRGRLYLVYASNNPAGNGNKPDIFCHYSDDQATTWSGANIVNDDVNTQNNHNWFPAVCCDQKTGRLFFSWMDTRDCPTSDSAMIYASFSDDGVNFAPNQCISQKKMKINCTTCGGGGAPAYYGDYNGVASDGKVSVMAWTDFRDGDFGSYVAYFPDFALSLSPSADTLLPDSKVSVTIPKTKLFNDTVYLSASISPNPQLFNITYPDGNKVASFPGSVPIVVSPKTMAPVGNYTLEIVATGSNGTPVHKRFANIVSINFELPAAAFAVSNDSACAGLPVSFTDMSTGPATSWQWSFPGGTPSASAEKSPQGIVYKEPGVYAVTLAVSNSLGSSTVTNDKCLTILPGSPAPAASGAEMCYGDQPLSMHAKGTNITWYDGSAVVGHDSIFYPKKIESGEYHFSVTQNLNGCESPPTRLLYTIHALPTVTLASFSGICPSERNFLLTGGLPSGGFYSGPGISDSIHFDATKAGQGQHEIAYIFKDQFGCSGTALQTINVFAAPALTFDSIMPLCANDAAVEMKASPAGGTFSGKGVTGHQFNPAFAGSGLQTVTYSFSDTATGCLSALSKNILVKPLPDLHLADVATCGNRKITFDASAAHGTAYLWTPGGFSTAEIQVDTVGRGLGMFTYMVKVTGENGCLQQDTVVAKFFDCTGFDDPAAGLFVVKPNPGNGIFNIQPVYDFPGGIYHLIITDVAGKQAFEKAITLEPGERTRVDASMLKPGVYTLFLASGKSTAARKLIIQK